MGHHVNIHFHHGGGGGGGWKKEKEHELPPKGCVAVRVGQEEERFVVPVAYLNHPLFVGLLKEAEEEYGFAHGGGAITIPCHVDHFRRVQRIIDRDARHVGLGVTTATEAGHNHVGCGHHHHHHHHHLPFHLYGCFKA